MLFYRSFNMNGNMPCEEGEQAFQNVTKAGNNKQVMTIYSQWAENYEQVNSHWQLLFVA